ncbi:MAG: Ribosomal RNA large subunit methyltransferase J [Beijerinckiaceae bacterium]|nr:MAG: Ribosomal RNA large subunit methyltransferase J [Beijerinckiaceae bacterium]
MGPEAEKTAEWHDGIGKLMAAHAAAEVQQLIQPYIQIAAPLIAGEPPRYGGSPWIAKALPRRQDRMVLCELHPRAFLNLRANLGFDARVKLLEMDGYAGLKALLPPVERRGLVLIDPPFEAADEFATAAEAIGKAWHKWASGIYMLWYPVKDAKAVALFMGNLAQCGVKRILRLELQIDRPSANRPLARSGLVIVNPPFRLEEEAKILLPSLAGILGDGKPGFLIDRLTGE